MGTIATKTLPLSVLPRDSEFQVRESGVDEWHVGQMAQVYREWKADGGECPIPKPVVFKIGAVYHPVAGFNRIAAMREAGLDGAEFEVRAGFSKSDAAVFAAESNLDHTALLMKKADVKRALLLYYDNVLDAKLLADGVLAKKFRVDRSTVGRWLKEHDPDREEQTERVGSDGRTTKVAASSKKAEPEADSPTVTLFDGGHEADAPPVASTGQGSSPPPPSPEKARGRATDDYPPDERFMPNAAEAEAICNTFASVKATLEGVRKRMRELLPDKDHPVAGQMIDLHGQFAADLNALIETLGHNRPEAVCPLCVGTTLRENDDPCGTCNRYGFMGRTDAAGNKAMWKRTGDRYDKLVKQADLSEVAD